MKDPVMQLPIKQDQEDFIRAQLQNDKKKNPA